MATLENLNRADEPLLEELYPLNGGRLLPDARTKGPAHMGGSEAVKRYRMPSI
jgi:hypothetical protein